MSNEREKSKRTGMNGHTLGATDEEEVGEAKGGEAEGGDGEAWVRRGVS